MENKDKNYFNEYRLIRNITLYYFVNIDGKTTKIEGNDH